MLNDPVTAAVTRLRMDLETRFSGESTTGYDQGLIRLER